MSEVMRENLRKLVNFVRRFSKELIIALVLAVIVAFVIEILTAYERVKTIKNNLKAIALIVTHNQEKGLVVQGSGFFINRNGAFVTNYHVIEGADWNSITAKLPSGAYYMIKDIIGIDKNSDIAILKFDAIENPFVEMGDSDQLHHGDEIVVIGAPEGLESTVSTGVISNPERTFNGLKLIQFTAPISHGSSGGGLFSKSGKTVGVVAAMLRPSETQNLNFAVPINVVKSVLTGGEKSFSLGSPEFFYSKGILAENRKEYDQAINYFKKAITLDEKYVHAFIDLGLAYDEKGLYNDELNVLKKAVLLDPLNSDGYYYLAMAYENNELYEKAIAAYEKVIEIKPTDKDAIYQLGILYIVQGKKNRAAALVPKLAELNAGLCNELKQLLSRVR